MPIELVIDTRETELIDRLSPVVKLLVEQLPVGDVLFREEGETVLVIERKTVADLKASICDGRGREQKARLLGTTPPARIMYLIEGSLDMRLDEKICGMPVSTLVGSIVNTQLRDGIKAYKTNSIGETVEFIQKLREKLLKEGDTYFKESSGISDAGYSSTLKASKKANMTPRVWLISQLSLVPQLSEKIAEAITDRYPTVIAITRDYESAPEHLRPKLLADITYQISGGKTRRVGDKLSSRVHEFFYGVE
jgi:ERCC4-type nuclease